MLCTEYVVKIALVIRQPVDGYRPEHNVPTTPKLAILLLFTSRSIHNDPLRSYQLRLGPSLCSFAVHMARDTIQASR